MLRVTAPLVTWHDPPLPDGAVEALIHGDGEALKGVYNEVFPRDSATVFLDTWGTNTWLGRP